jgi:uncharacterized protein (TIGR03437 family)
MFFSNLSKESALDPHLYLREAFYSGALVFDGRAGRLRRIYFPERGEERWPWRQGKTGFNRLHMAQLTAFLCPKECAGVRDLLLKILISTRASFMNQTISTQIIALGILACSFPSSVLAAPTVTQVLNNSSLTPRGLPNSGIAPSSIFIVRGSGLADPGTPVLQDTQAPGGLPSTLNGASITVVVGGVTTHPPIYYTSPTQIAAVLPATTPVGTGTLTVTYNGAISAAASILVVPSAVGINQYNQIPIPLGMFNTNVDVGVATDNTTGEVLSFINSGSPGQTIVVWVTGLGADPADSDNSYIAMPHAINTPMQVYLGGALINVLYQGASVYPGVDVIIFTIPPSAPNSCYVPFLAVTGTVVSNVVTFPIHPGGGTCVEPQTGGLTITGDQILKNTQDTYRGGSLGLIQTNTTNAKGILTVTNNASGGFAKISGLLAGAVGRGGIISPGGCSVYPIIGGGPLTITGLDAGSITVTGPTGPAVAMPTQLGIKGQYGAILAASGIPPSGGTFTFKGTGGADVGAFTATAIMSNPLFNWTNQSAASTVDRTQGLTVTWTGGLAGTYVLLSGTSTSSSVTAGFSCRVAVESGQFTVPAYILLGLPAGSGGTSVQQQDTVSTFSATGLDIAGVTGAIEFSVTTTYK